ncbi:MAG: tRNA-wybutosine modification methyltransferase TYW3 [Thermoplasmatota archaeon]
MSDIRSETLRKLDEAASLGLVDEDIMPLLNSINSIDDLVTTSSCSGRFQLISVPRTGDKPGSCIIGKWHRTISKDEMMQAISGWDGEGELHLLVQPLLVHVRARDISYGAMLRSIAQESSLKFSTIRSVKLGSNGNLVPWGVVVEMLGTERMEVPIDGIDRDTLEKCMGPWVRRGNELIVRTKGHIPRLIEALERTFKRGLDP